MKTDSMIFAIEAMCNTNKLILLPPIKLIIVGPTKYNIIDSVIDIAIEAIAIILYWCSKSLLTSLA